MAEVTAGMPSPSAVSAVGPAAHDVNPAQLSVDGGAADEPRRDGAANDGSTSTSDAGTVWGSEEWSGYAATALARVMFYPSLAYNIARSTIQPDYRWYTEVVENLLLGALPFHSMLDDFKEQGIGAVLTLNEDFELFVTSEDYKELGIEHLHLPTIDFLFAPGRDDMLRAVKFIQGNLQQGRRTYVHCKAGRGRSATVVVCFMVLDKGMTPEEALAFVRDRRPQISLAPGQWTAVLDFYNAFCQQGEPAAGADAAAEAEAVAT